MDHILRIIEWIIENPLQSYTRSSKSATKRLLRAAPQYSPKAQCLRATPPRGLHYCYLLQFTALCGALECYKALDIYNIIGYYRWIGLVPKNVWWAFQNVSTGMRGPGVSATFPCTSKTGTFTVLNLITGAIYESNAGISKRRCEFVHNLTQASVWDIWKQPRCSCCQIPVYTV